MEQDFQNIFTNLENAIGNEKTLETLRELRTRVAEKNGNIFSDGEIKKNFSEKMCSLLQNENELIRRLTWQVIHNASVGNPEFLNEIISKLHSKILTDLKVEVPKTSNVICAIILQFMKHSSEENSDPDNEILSLELFREILRIVKNVENCDFAILLLEHILTSRDFEIFTENLEHEYCLTLFEFIQNIQENDKLNEKLLLFIVGEFKKKSGNLLTTFNKDLEVDPLQSSRLLEILSKASANQHHQRILQKDMSLLIDVLYVLRMMHDAGKSGEEEALKPVNNMEILDANIDTESPVYGFKCNLIRLIGNLCYKHKENQDQVRDCSGIELLLDCSPPDAKNPMITQWVILAIQNLCQNNLENQKVVAKIDKKGQLDKKKLSELGIDIFDDEQK